MKWLNFNSLQNRYAVLTLILATIMLALSWFAQNQISQVKKNIQQNIESRNSLFQRNRHIRNSLWHFRDLLNKFQIDPKQFEDPYYLQTVISQTINHIERLSAHPWINKNYSSTISELILTINDFESITQKLIKIRLTPQELFPSLKVANSKMQPLYAVFTENLNLAIIDIQDNYSRDKQEEYRLLVQLQYQWTQMISNFRMYLLNRLNSFEESFLINQLHLITEQHNVITEKITVLKRLDKQDKLEFDTSIALEKFSAAGIEWMKFFKIVRHMNESNQWRADTIIYHNELAPKLEKINQLLRILDLAIERFSENDIKTLSDLAQRQVNSLWFLTIIGLLLLLTGFVFLVKLILSPISIVTKALKDESKGIEAKIQPDVSILETRNLFTAFTEMRLQIHSRQTELEYHALHDSLTGLGNRDLLNDRIQQAIHNAQQERTTFAVLIMDLDRFKEVNDTLGHALGDLLLQSVAQRLITTLREVDVIVRLGGDEFAVLLNTANREDAEIIARKILNAFQTVFIINDISLYMGVSIGVSLYPEHGSTQQTILQHADIAMYVAKRNKTGHEVYDVKYDEYSIGKLSLISDIRTAIDKKQLFLKYQPVINLKTGEIVSAEALLRWNHPKFGEVSPDEIIPIAEQTGLINPITHWVVDTAAKYNYKLKKQGINIKIAINLSVYNLQEYNFVERIIKTFEENKVPASDFVMEITESTIMTNPKKSIDILSKLDELGIEISVDDFGTGYSSLTYLKKLPLSKLKIDKSFIMDMIEDDNDAMIVRSTIDLAHNLGMSVIAEGIEEKEGMDLLNILGCELGQGYYFSRPIEDEEFEKWFIKNNP